MTELEAIAELAKLAQTGELSTQLRSCWDDELAWEQEWILEQLAAKVADEWFTFPAIESVFCYYRLGLTNAKG